METGKLEQAITDGLGALALALSRQVDAKRLATDLLLFAQELRAQKSEASAGLVDEMARTIETRAHS